MSCDHTNRLVFALAHSPPGPKELRWCQECGAVRTERDEMWLVPQFTRWVKPTR